MDTINTPTIRKKLKILSAQDPGESRRRWQHVTEALLKKDVDAATEAKHAVRLHNVCRPFLELWRGMGRVHTFKISSDFR